MMPTGPATGRAPRPTSICFFFNAQRHQLLHGIGTAVALARRPGFDVYVVSPAEGHIAYAREAAERLGGAPITFVCARSKLMAAGMRHTGSVVPPKLLSLGVLARWLNGFDAIALPERTSMILRRIGVRRPRFIHLDHGAGDRAAGFDRRIRQFDFVLMAGPKHRERLMADRLIRPGAHAVVGYPKFAAAEAMRDRAWRPFDNDRPIVLYNPHFSPLGSWERCAEAVLEAFAAQDRYNLIVAPHVRLLDGAAARTRWEPLLARYAGLPHILIDRGGDRAIDMTYTSLADVYLGDVSSQVYEFLDRPRPCLFLNPLGVAWHTDENYAHWRFGPVLPDADDLVAAVDTATATHPAWRAAQEEGYARTFLPGGGAETAAAAIAGYLDERRSGTTSAPPNRAGGSARRPWTATPKNGWIRRWATIAATVLFLGLVVDEVVEHTPGQASSPFVDRAVASHQTTRLRNRMASQIEAAVYDRGEIRRATGIAMPALPAAWAVGDVQLFPTTSGNLIQVALRTPAGESVSLIAMRIETPAEATPLLESRAREQVAYWEKDAFAFALVGELPSARLLTLAAAMASRPLA